MGEALERGMVLVLSLWDDKLTHMKWLDSMSGKGDDSSPGVARGPCAPSAGKPEVLRSQHGGASVRYTNFMFGEIDSTYLVEASVKPDHAAKDGKSYYAKRLSQYTSGAASLPPAPATLSLPPQAASPTPKVCGKEYELCSSGPKCCNSGCTCQTRFWSTKQCIPDSGRSDCPGSAQALHMDDHVVTQSRDRPPVPESNMFSGWVFFFLAIQTCCVCILAPYMWRKARHALNIGKNGALRPATAAINEQPTSSFKQHAPTVSMIANRGGGIQDSPTASDDPAPQKQSRKPWRLSSGRRHMSPARGDEV